MLLPLNRYHRTPRLSIAAGLVLAALIAPPAPARPNAADPAQAARQSRADYAAALSELASWCEARGLNEEAQRTRSSLAPTDPYKLYVAVLPKQVGSQPLPPGASADQAQWHARLNALRQDQADALWDLARRAAKAGRASLAFELVLGAIQANPDHEPIRRLIGQQKLKGQWCSPYEVRRLRAGQVWNPSFGWLPEAHVARYQQGQRYTNGKWITAEEDAQLHRDIRSGWDVETEHYTIRTNHSLEAGAALGTKLEKLYQLWSQLFVRYYATAEQVVAQFEGRRAAPLELPRHRVVYFRDKDDYVGGLRAAFPNIETTIGAYVQKTGRAYFFASSQPDDRTIYHEATHQLFHESRPVAANVGLRGNFWIVEGIAMYMESLREENGFYVLGGLDDLRVHAARYRLLTDDFYVPLAELTLYGMDKLQSDPRVATLYSQCAGLTHFLIYAQNGRYRDALVAYLTAVYSGRDTPATLSRLTGQSYPDLDRQYRLYTQSAPNDN